MEKNKGNLSIIILVVATMFWGSTFAFTKELTKSFIPINLITLRFGLTSIIMFLLFSKKIIQSFKNISMSVLGWLTVLGILNFSAIILQTMGLSSISATNSGFITSLAIIFVPLIDFFLRKNKISIGFRFAMVILLIGTYILSYGFDLPKKFILGDVLTLCCAIIYSFYIILVDFLSKKTNAIGMMFYVFFITTIIALPCSICVTNTIPQNVLINFVQTDQIFNMLFLVIFGTIIPYIFMGIGQKYLDAQRSSLIYLLEPVFAMFIAVTFFGELLIYYQIIGGIIILLSQIIVVNETKGLERK